MGAPSIKEGRWDSPFHLVTSGSIKNLETLVQFQPPQPLKAPELELLIAIFLNLRYNRLYLKA